MPERKEDFYGNDGFTLPALKPCPIDHEKYTIFVDPSFYQV